MQLLAVIEQHNYDSPPAIDVNLFSWFEYEQGGLHYNPLPWGQGRPVLIVLPSAHIMWASMQAMFDAVKLIMWDYLCGGWSLDSIIYVLGL